MIKYWFPTLILYRVLEEFKQHNPALIEKVGLLFEKNKASFKSSWACETFNTLGYYNYSTDKDPIVCSLVETFKKIVLEFSKEFGVNKPLESLECTDFWFNLAAPGDFQEFHRHANSHFSLAYYVDVPKDSGSIVFQSFETNTDMFTLPIDNITDASCKTCVYEPEESALIVFRSNLIHMVKKNQSNRNRISISANFKFI